MTDLVVACVWWGDRYSIDYVSRLERMLKRYLSMDFEFVVLTANPGLLKSTATVDVSGLGLHSWWNKMFLFSPDWRQGKKVLYYDLDTVLCGTQRPLAALDLDFGVCANFTRAAGNLEWPCRYGSCVMMLGPELDGSVWDRFWNDRHAIMARAGKYGDQFAIEELIPKATLFQSILPEFFMGYRELPRYPLGPPPGCSAVVFAGKSKPHNTDNEWVKKAWVS